MMAKPTNQSSPFAHVLPSSQLGTSHTSPDSYNQATSQTGKRNESEVPIEFSLVVLLTPNSQQQQQRGNSSNVRILLGKKLRGFGKGFYNCFGGKLEKSLDEHKHPAKGAVREIKEETGVNVPIQVMEDDYVGTLNFTFEDWEVNKAMKVYLYCVVLSLSSEKQDGDVLNPDGSRSVVVDPEEIRGCDEIEPVWFNDAFDIPLQQMFADDSLWLTMLLKHYDDIFKPKPSLSTKQSSARKNLMFDAWFHFQAGGAETNQILHHHIQMNGPETIPLCSSYPPKSTETKFTLEKQLFHALHLNHIHSPSIKEFKENYAMANAVRRHMGDEDRMEYVIDVAGGHGALGK